MREYILSLPTFFKLDAIPIPAPIVPQEPKAPVILLTAERISFKVINNYLGNEVIIICEDKLKNAASRRTLPLIPHIEKMLIEEKNVRNIFQELVEVVITMIIMIMFARML